MQHTHAKFINENTVEFPPVNDNTRGIINYFSAPELLEAGRLSAVCWYGIPG